MTEHYFDAEPSSEFLPRRITIDLRGNEFTVTTANAVFSGDRLDKATRILLDEVTAPPRLGAALDLGCGWGPIALALADSSPELDVWALDVNERALELARRNAEEHGFTNVRAVTADEIPSNVEFDVIWSNPPIRIGKEALDALQLTRLPRLAVGGEAYLVVGKNLGADSLHRRMADALGNRFAVDRVATSGGFRILRVVREA